MKTFSIQSAGLLITALLWPLCSPLCAAEVRVEAEVWALRGATIDAAYGGPKVPVTVVVKRGLITCVSPTCAVPATARVIDGRGWVLTSGMVEGAAHIGMMEVAMEKSSHDGVVRGVDNAADVLARDGIALNSRVVRAALRGGVSLAISAPRSAALISGQSAAFETSAVTIGRAIRHPLVALHIRVGERAKSKRPMSGARSGQFAVLRGLFDAAIARRQSSKNKRAPTGLLAGQHTTLSALRALEPALDGKQMVAFHAHRAADISACIRLVRRYGFHAIIVGGAEAYVVASELKKASVGVLLTPSRANRFATLRAQPDAANRLHRAGVRFALATGDTFNARNLRWVAGLSVRRGLPRTVALKAITTGAMDIWGLPTHDIAVGKRANLVAFRGEPLALDGRVVFVAVGETLLVQPTQR